MSSHDVCLLLSTNLWNHYGKNTYQHLPKRAVWTLKKWCIGTPYIPYHPFSNAWKIQVSLYAQEPWDDFPKQPKVSQGSSSGATDTGVAHTEAATHRSLHGNLRVPPPPLPGVHPEIRRPYHGIGALTLISGWLTYPSLTYPPSGNKGLIASLYQGKGLLWIIFNQIIII